MASPTFQPVKNFAFIKSASWIEYDLLPVELRGSSDCFHFVDTPVERPSGYSWKTSVEESYYASAGWTVADIFDNYDSIADTGNWVKGTWTRLYWNTITNEHTAKRASGYLYIIRNPVTAGAATYTFASLDASLVPEEISGVSIVTAQVDASDSTCQVMFRGENENENDPITVEGEGQRTLGNVDGSVIWLPGKSILVTGKSCSISNLVLVATITGSEFITTSAVNGFVRS